MWLVSSAFALSCPSPYHGWIPPEDGILPANGEIVLIVETGRFPDTAWFFLEQDGVTYPAIEADIEPRTADTYALIPLEPLEPGVTYGLAGMVISEGLSLADTPDLDPPAPPVVTARRTSGDIGGWSQDPFDFLSFDVVDPSARVEIEIEELDGTLHLLSTNGSFSFGTASGCIFRPNPYTMGAELTVRARNVDWAGNTSDWTELVVDEHHASTGCGCAQRPGGVWTSALAWLARR